jgi:hypothetical protein
MERKEERQIIKSFEKWRKRNEKHSMLVEQDCREFMKDYYKKKKMRTQRKEGKNRGSLIEHDPNRFLFRKVIC